MSEDVKERLIVALDVDTACEALELFTRLGPFAGMFKIGSRLFTAAGPSIVREIVGAGGRVFLDLKFHDIPAVVAAAGVEATRLGVSLFTAHASGGGEMMLRLSDAISETASREGITRPRAIGVTVLTSFDARTLAQIGIAPDTEEQVRRLARLASESGMDGAVASPQEVKFVREAVERSDFLVVTPGVNPGGAAYADQKRVTSPSEAIRAGSDYLVIGRAITGSSDPERAAREIIGEMEQALATTDSKA